MKTKYEVWKPQGATREQISDASEICETYAAQGYVLTLRQLYYQFVARGLLPNNMKSYKTLGANVARARMAGYLDWDHIEDRTRNVDIPSTWGSPHSIIRSAATSYATDLWHDQPTYVEVWVEKEALAGVVERAADIWQVPWFSCRGYVSLSEMHSTAKRLERQIFEYERPVVILHLGDHDPSGLDMSRDIRDRLETFIMQDWFNKNWSTNPGAESSIRSLYAHLGDQPPLTINRLALNWDQVQEYNPPPNPAKLTDSRASDYVERFGSESWELDALEPAVLNNLIQDNVTNLLDLDRYRESQAAQEVQREALTETARRWEEVQNFLRTAS